MQVLSKPLSMPPHLPRVGSTSGRAYFSVGGASIGLVAFLVLGLLPSLLLGSAAGTSLALELGAHGYGTSALIVSGDAGTVAL